MKLFLILIFSAITLFSNEEFNAIKEPYFKSYDYEQMGKYQEAIKVLSPLYNKYPKGYTLNLRFGWLFYLDKKYTDALKYYQQASLVNSYALDPRLGLIRVHLELKDYKKAEMLTYKLLKIDYYNYYGNIYMIQALIAQKKYEIAKSITQKMLNLYPTDIAYLELLSIVYKKTTSKYLHDLYENILILDPNNILVRSEMK